MSNTILVTGAAGFIGFHTCKQLIKNNYKVIGIDNINPYYSRDLKKARLNELENLSKNIKNPWKFFKANIEDLESINKIFIDLCPKIVINLAAQAGVRYSIQNPQAYINSNLLGFMNILECCRNHKVQNFLYASSSSVYGGNQKIPFSEKDPVNHPVSLYAATKKANEAIAHSYSHLYGIPSTGLRFFTVYGPWGRPDMAPMIFTNSIFSKVPINIFNNGNMSRDFTYIDDVVEIIKILIKKPAQSNPEFDNLNPNPSTSWAPHKILNVGRGEKVKLLDFINIIEKELDIKAIKNFLPMQKGDVIETFADIEELKKWANYEPKINIDKGIKEFLIWYKNYYKIV